MRAKPGEARKHFDQRLTEMLENPISGCELWPFAKTRAGYGVLNVDGQTEYVHRLSCVSLNGPSQERWARHSCDRPACWNPQHLNWGTHEDNMADMKRRGRGRKGSDRTKLTDDQVRAVRCDPRTYREIAEDYGVTHPVVSNVKNRRSYKWVQDDVEGCDS